jgi:hypothetical protein
MVQVVEKHCQGSPGGRPENGHGHLLPVPTGCWISWDDVKFNDSPDMYLRIILDMNGYDI